MEIEIPPAPIPCSRNLYKDCSPECPNYRFMALSLTFTSSLLGKLPIEVIASIRAGGKVSELREQHMFGSELKELGVLDDCIRSNEPEIDNENYKPLG